MNIENLNKIADHIDGGGDGRFDMRPFECCVVGQAIRYFEPEATKGKFWNYDWTHGATMRLFGIPDQRNEPIWLFLFGGAWPSDTHMAAERLRYVARHGGPPSSDQWKNFELTPPAVVEAPVWRTWPAPSSELTLSAVVEAYSGSGEGEAVTEEDLVCA